MSIACGADPFFVGSDVLDIGSRKSELRGRRNRMAPTDHAFPYCKCHRMIVTLQDIAWT